MFICLSLAVCLTCVNWNWYSSFWNNCNNLEKKKAMEVLKEGGKELKDAVQNIIEDCTQSLWEDKFEPNDAKSVLAL